MVVNSEGRGCVIHPMQNLSYKTQAKAWIISGYWRKPNAIVVLFCFQKQAKQKPGFYAKIRNAMSTF